MRITGLSYLGIFFKFYSGFSVFKRTFWAIFWVLVGSNSLSLNVFQTSWDLRLSECHLTNDCPNWGGINSNIILTSSYTSCSAAFPFFLMFMAVFRLKKTKAFTVPFIQGSFSCGITHDYHNLNRFTYIISYYFFVWRVQCNPRNFYLTLTSCYILIFTENLPLRDVVQSCFSLALDCAYSSSPG